jgi:uncharacterized membrane protein YdjX (TVP38/TMEM64 family)
MPAGRQAAELLPRLLRSFRAMMSSRLALAILALAVVSAVLSLLVGQRVALAMVAGAAWLRDLGFFGWLIFVALEIAVTLIGIVPGALLGLVAGAIYGVGIGFLAGAAGILSGALIAFGLSRSMLRPWIGRMLRHGARLAALDAVIARDGWRLVALLRISPVMPFSLTSYALGFSGIGLRDYALGTLASLPLLLGYVVIGALGGLGAASWSQGFALVHLTVLALGALATLALILHLSRLVAGALRVASLPAA